MSPYIFTIAAALAVIGIISVFKINVNKIKENPEQLEKAQTSLFIGTAVSESFPLIMIVFALINATQVPIDELYIPALLIIFMMVFATFFIFLQGKVDVEEDQKAVVTRFSMITIALVNAIPIVALVLMFMNIA